MKAKYKIIKRGDECKVYKRSMWFFYKPYKFIVWYFDDKSSDLKDLSFCDEEHAISAIEHVNTIEMYKGIKLYPYLGPSLEYEYFKRGVYEELWCFWINKIKLRGSMDECEKIIDRWRWLKIHEEDTHKKDTTKQEVKAKISYYNPSTRKVIKQNEL